MPHTFRCLTDEVDTHTHTHTPHVPIHIRITTHDSCPLLPEQQKSTTKSRAINKTPVAGVRNSVDEGNLLEVEVIYKSASAAAQRRRSACYQIRSIDI